MGALKADDLPRGCILALDTVVLIYFLEKHPVFYPTAREIFRKIEENCFPALISSLVFAELLVTAYKGNKATEAMKLMQVLTGFPHLKIAPLTPSIAAQAARLRAAYGIRTPDAIHLATAIEGGAAGFITNDKDLERLQKELPIWMIG